MEVNVNVCSRLACLLLLVLSLAPALPAAGPAQTVDATAVDAVVQEALKAWQVPGAAVAMVRGDEVVYLKGHGVRELGKPDPVTPDTLLAIGSTTKGFTATAVGMLVDDGKMAWDDLVRKHVGHRLVYHGGNIDGFSALVALLPRHRLGIVVLTNRHVTQLPSAVAYSLFDQALGLPKTDWNAELGRQEKQRQEQEAAAAKALAERRRPGTKPARELAAYARAFDDAACGGEPVY